MLKYRWWYVWPKYIKKLTKFLNAVLSADPLPRVSTRWWRAHILSGYITTYCSIPWCVSRSVCLLPVSYTHLLRFPISLLLHSTWPSCSRYIDEPLIGYTHLQTSASGVDLAMPNKNFSQTNFFAVTTFVIGCRFDLSSDYVSIIRPTADLSLIHIFFKLIIKNSI